MSQNYCVTEGKTLVWVVSIHFSWWSNLEKTNWLHHISLLLKASNIVVNAIHEEQRPVVVHCSDGWDRTTQIVALAELMLDPYYRTIEVFTLTNWSLFTLQR